MGLRLALGILELLVRGEVALHLSDFSADENIRNARAGIFGFSCVCAGVFRDVCRGAGSDENPVAEMNWLAAFNQRLARLAISILLLAIAVSLCAPMVHAGNPILPPEAQQGLEKLNSGDPDAAIVLFRG